jgi:hypothetical protein
MSILEHEEDDAPAPEPGPEVTPELFRVWRSPRTGAQNPERLTNPVWDWLVRSRASAYGASQRFGFGGRPLDDPGWSFARFGQSETRLEDGRVVYIAGEHEDHYDPDFYIYNDVVIRSPDDRIEIFGYPLDVFPPTDFHSATLAGDRILIIGNLGYSGKRRPGTTQVVSIDLATLSSSLIETHGDPPGWIHGHSATLDTDAAIVVSRGQIETGRGPSFDFRENGDDWRLDLTTLRWERLTERHWREWQVRRADRQSMHLWRVRSLARFRGVEWSPEFRAGMKAMVEQTAGEVRAAYGADADLDLFATLFAPNLVHTALPDDPEEHGVHRIHVDGIVVRYVERMQSVKLVVEGRLPDEVCFALVRDLRTKLGALEHTEYVDTEL